MTDPQGLDGVSGDEARLSPYMTQEAEANTAVRRTDSGGIRARNLRLLDGIVEALGIEYTFPKTLVDEVFLKHTADGQLEWAPAQGAPGIQGPPGPTAPIIPPTTTLPFSSITGQASRGQLVSNVAYEDEANDFGTNKQTILNLDAPNLQRFVRFISHG